MTFSSGDSATPMAALLNQAVTEGKAYTDAQLAVINWTTFTPTAGGSSTAGVCRYRKFGPMVEIRLAITYQGSGITAGADGYMGLTTVLTGVGFPAGILPSQTLFLSGRLQRTGVFIIALGCHLSATGELRVSDSHPSATMISDDLIFVTATYATG